MTGLPEALAGAMQKHKPREKRRSLWHYTTGKHLRGILETGAILPNATPGLDGKRIEVPAVWFTYSDDWEPGTGAGTQATPDRVFRAAAGFLKDGEEGLRRAMPHPSPREVGMLARIRVAPEVAPLTWRDFVNQGLFDPSTAPVQQAVDRALGADQDEWRASLEAVPASKWLAIEVRSGVKGRDNKWRPLRPGDLSVS